MATTQVCINEVLVRISVGASHILAKVYYILILAVQSRI
jgi:hypothetical protein